MRKKPIEIHHAGFEQPLQMGHNILLRYYHRIFIQRQLLGKKQK